MTAVIVNANPKPNGFVHVEYEGGAKMFTWRQWTVLRKTASGDCFAYGADVRVARNLESMGLTVVEDCGSLTLNGRSDGERWHVKLTELGKVVASAVERRTP